jgi:hypothetical protein
MALGEQEPLGDERAKSSSIIHKRVRSMSSRVAVSPQLGETPFILNRAGKEATFIPKNGKSRRSSVVCPRSNTILVFAVAAHRTVHEFVGTAWIAWYTEI